MVGVVQCALLSSAAGLLSQLTWLPGKQAPLHYSNVQIVDPVTGKPVRIGHRFLEDGTKARRHCVVAVVLWLLAHVVCLLAAVVNVPKPAPLSKVQYWEVEWTLQNSTTTLTRLWIGVLLCLGRCASRGASTLQARWCQSQG